MQTLCGTCNSMCCVIKSYCHCDSFLNVLHSFCVQLAGRTSIIYEWSYFFQYHIGISLFLNPRTIRGFSLYKKARTRRAFAGAEKRIRTSGRVTPVTRFPIVLLKPLRHLCILWASLAEAFLYYMISQKNASVFSLFFQFFLENL